MPSRSHLGSQFGFTCNEELLATLYLEMFACDADLVGPCRIWRKPTMTNAEVLGLGMDHWQLLGALFSSHAH